MKFCEYCGKSLEEGQVCDCEGAQKAAQKQQTMDQAAAAVQESLKREVQVGGTKMPLKKLLVMAAAVLILLVCGSFISNRPSTVKWDKYVNVQFSGVDSRGIAELQMDWNGLNGSIKSSRRRALGTAEITVDRSEHLNNGDEVTVYFQYDAPAFEDSRLKVKKDSVTFKVEGLTKAQPVDAFADLEVTFQGVDGFGTAVITNHSADPFIQGMSFSVEENQNLSNDQPVVVHVEYDQQLADSKAIAVPEVDRTYTVSGLTTLVNSIGDLNEEVLKSLDAQCRDYITTMLFAENTRYNYNGIRGYYTGSTPTMENVVLSTSYVCSRKNIERDDPMNNFIVCVYEIEAKDTENPEGSTFYYSVAYPCLQRDAQGTVTIDLNHVADQYSNKGGNSLNEVYGKTVALAVKDYNVSQG